MGPFAGSALILTALATPAIACNVAAGSASPLRAAVAAVKYLPQTEAWEQALPPGRAAQYILHLDRTRHFEGRCYWTLEVRAGGTLWKRFLVTAGGGKAIEEVPGKPKSRL